MTTFNPGTGGTLKSVTWEAALFEAAQLLDTAEQADTANTSNFIAVDPNPVGNTLDLNANLPFTVAIDSATGKPTISAFTYCVQSFTPGTGSDLKATTLQEAVLEIAQKVQNLEQSQGETNRLNLIYNTDQLLCSIVTTNPYTVAINASGGLTYTAIPYLT